MVRVAWEERCSAREVRSAASDADRVSRGTCKDGREAFPGLLCRRHTDLGYCTGLPRGAGWAEQHGDRCHSPSLLLTTGCGGSDYSGDSGLSRTPDSAGLTGTAGSVARGAIDFKNILDSLHGGILQEDVFVHD